MDIGRKSRGAYNIQCMMEYFASLLMEDAFLAKLLRHLGMSDALTGIVSSLVTVSFLAELVFFPLIRRVRSAKRTVILFDFASMACFSLAYALPLFNVSGGAGHALVILLILGGYLSAACIRSLYFVWANSFVAPEKRARFSALKEMTSLLGGVLFSLGMGVLFDTLEQQGRTVPAFSVFAGMIMLVNLLSVLCLCVIGPGQERERAGDDTLLLMKRVVKNRPFMKVTLMAALWYAARYFSCGFLGAYKTGELMLSVATIEVINVVGCLSRFALSMPFGAYSDRTSYAKGFFLSMVLAAGAFAANLFTVRATWWLTVVYSILINVSFAGNNANLLNISYSYVDQELLVPAMMLKSGVCGVAGILASLLGGLMLDSVQTAGNRFLGVSMTGFQAVSLVSFLLTAGVILFCRRIMEKQPE